MTYTAKIGYIKWRKQRALEWPVLKLCPTVYDKSAPRFNHYTYLKLIWILPVCLALGGCMTAAKHQQQLGETQERALTLGLVQTNIKVGMSQSDVVAALGSPNIVTGDSQNRETWIYDKIASEASFSSDSGSFSSNVSGYGNFPSGYYYSPGNSGSVSGNIGGGYNRQAGAASITQRTLTVIIKFTSTNTVESVTYNSTKF